MQIRSSRIVKKKKPANAVFVPANCFLGHIPILKMFASWKKNVSPVGSLVNTLYFETHWKQTSKTKKHLQTPEKDSVAWCFISQKNEHLSKHTVVSYFHISAEPRQQQDFNDLYALLDVRREKVN